MNERGLIVDIESMRYPSSRASEVLIRDVHLRVMPRRFVSILGRSGAGKTTLLRIVAGLEQRFQGRVLINSLPVCRPSTSVQMVFQDSRLFPWKTVFENIAFATNDPSGVRTRREVIQWLDRLGLADKANEWPKSLSGGEATRIAIARALIVQPKALLLDEPFQSLDLITRFEVQDELVNALSLNLPLVLMVSHSIDDAVFLSDEIHVLTTRPMEIARTFSVPIPRPRHRGQLELSRIAADIAQFLAGSSTKLEQSSSLGFKS